MIMLDYSCHRERFVLEPGTGRKHPTQISEADYARIEHSYRSLSRWLDVHAHELIYVRDLPVHMLRLSLCGLGQGFLNCVCVTTLNAVGVASVAVPLTAATQYAYLAKGFHALNTCTWTNSLTMVSITP
jgi:hypothetical protein